MIKFLITPERFSEAATVAEFLAVYSGGLKTAMRILPRFLIDSDGKYVVGVVMDSDGDPTSFENVESATVQLMTITPKRLERLQHELVEAAKAIVDPPKGKA